MFSCLASPMPILPPVPEPVSFEEVAAVLDAAAMSVRGGPPRSICPAGLHLAAALDAAGFRVVREPDGRQLTL